MNPEPPAPLVIRGAEGTRSPLHPLGVATWATLVTVFLTSVGVVVMTPLTLVQPLLGLLGLFGALIAGSIVLATVGFAMLVWLSVPTEARVSETGVVLGQRSIPVSAIRAVHVSGAPGRPVRVALDVGYRLVLREVRRPRGHGGFLAELDQHRSLAVEVAERLGVPVVDELAPEAAWQAHAAQQVEALRDQIRARFDRNVQHFPHLHREPAEEPPALWTPEGLTLRLPGSEPHSTTLCGALVIDRHRAHSKLVQTDLLAIERAFVDFERTHDGEILGAVRIEHQGLVFTALRVRVQARTGLFAPPVAKVGHLHWVAQTLHRLASEARPPEPEGEVPEALLQLTAAARRPQGNPD